MTPEQQLIAALFGALGIMSTVIAVLWKRGNQGDDDLVAELRDRIANLRAEIVTLRAEIVTLRQEINEWRRGTHT